MAGFVYLVGAGPGDPGLLTVRAVECLGRAEVVIADRLVAPEILSRYVPKTAELISRPPRHEALDQEALNRLLVERGLRGQRVVRLKGGDPFIFGRGGEEAEALVAAKIPFLIVPGVTAGVAAAAYAGIPLTHRGRAAAVTFATGHESDEKAAGDIAWGELARSAATLVVYMSVARLPGIMRRLREAGRSGAEPVAVIERATTPGQRIVVGTLDDIGARVERAGLAPPALAIVGEVVRLREQLGDQARRRLLVLTTKEPTIERPELALHWVAPLSIVPRVGEVAAALASREPARTLVFVSAHAVDAVFEGLERGGKDARLFAGQELAAIGAATARRLKERGLVAERVGEGGGGELARLLDDGRAPSERTARLFGAAGGRLELAEALRTAGWRVEVVAAYESIANDAALDLAIAAHQERPFAAIAFTSPRGVEAFHARLGAATLAGVTVGAIGETTRLALAQRGVAVAVLPAAPDLAALIDGLAAA